MATNDNNENGSEKLIIKDREAEALNFIITEYFKVGFGSLSKSDVDLIFFTALMKYGDITDKSEYALSKVLKITQSRIRNLKIKKELKYPKLSFDEIKNVLMHMAEFARVDDEGRKLSLPIFDPNIFIELEHIIELNNGFVEAQLNSKIFTIRIDQLIILLFYFDSDGENNRFENVKDKYLKKVRSIARKEKSLTSKIDTDKITSFKEFKEFLYKGGSDSILDFVGKTLPGAGYPCEFIKKIKNRIT